VYIIVNLGTFDFEIGISVPAAESLKFFSARGPWRPNRRELPSGPWQTNRVARTRGATPPPTNERTPGGPVSSIGTLEEPVAHVERG
jgi:hypothetical protein